MWNPFKRSRSLPDSSHPIQVLIINDGAEMVPEKLGITDERSRELHRAMAAILDAANKKGCHDVCELLCSLSSHCKHPNELAHMAYVLGMVIERSKSPMSFIQSILGKP